MTGRLRPYEALDEMQQRAIDALYNHDEQLALLGSIEASEFAKVFHGRLSVSFMRCDRIGKTTQIYLLHVDFYVGGVPTDLRMPANTFIARDIRRALAHVRHVLAVSRQTQILEPVVVANHVAMVNAALGPISGDVSPYQPMREHVVAVQRDRGVARLARRPGYRSELHPVARHFLPAKDTRFWVIFQVLSQYLDAHFRIFNSHLALLVHI